METSTYNIGRRKCCLTTQSPIIRFFILFTASSFFFTCTAVDDLVSAAVPTLRESLDLSATQVSILYSASPVNAILASLVTSFLVGRARVRTLSLIACCFVLVGNLIFIYTESFELKIVGRALFGLGEGPLEVLMTLICMRWFLENDPLFPTLEVSFGVTSAAGMLGAATGLSGIPFLLEKFWPDTYAYSFVAFVPAITVVIAIIFYVVDFWADPFLDPREQAEGDTPGVWCIIKSLSTEYWILFFMCGTLWSIIYVIMIFLTDYLSEKWHFTNLQSGLYSCIVFFTGIPVSIVVGWVISKKGLVLSLLALGGVLFTISCLILGVTKIDPIFGVVGLGISTGLFEPTVFTAIAMVLPERGSDTAFSFTALIFQFVIFVAPFGFGLIRDRTGAYDLVFILCSLFGVLNVGLTLWLGRLSPNLQHGSTLSTEEEVLLNKNKRKSADNKFFSLISSGFLVLLLCSILYSLTWGWVIWFQLSMTWFASFHPSPLEGYLPYLLFFSGSVLLHSSWINLLAAKVKSRLILHMILIWDFLVVLMSSGLTLFLALAYEQQFCSTKCTDFDFLGLALLFVIFSTLSLIFCFVVIFWYKRPWCIGSLPDSASSDSDLDINTDLDIKYPLDTGFQTDANLLDEM